jgi:putative membrane protein
MTPSEPASVDGNPPPGPPPFGFLPVDHAAPDTDDVARRTNQRTILANISTSVLAGAYAAFRFQTDFNKGGRNGPLVSTSWVLLGIIPFITIHFVIELLRWRAFTFRVNEHRLVIDKGLLTRHHVVVPFDRVQQVDVRRRLTAMILGLASVRIDTAGMGEHTSVHLRYLDPTEANGLRAFILQHRDARAAEAAERDAKRVGSTVTAAPTEETVLALGPKRLVVAALTHNSVLSVLPLFGGLALWSLALAALASREPLSAAMFGLGALAVGGLTLLIVVQVMISTVVQHWGYTLSHTGDDLHLRFGLTDQRHLTVPRRRIQHIEVTDNPLRRALGVVSVHLHSAASVAGAGQQGVTKFEIPLLRRDELAVILPLIVGDPWFVIPELTSRPRSARRRAIIRRSALLAIFVAPIVVLLGARGLPALALVGLGVPWGDRAHRRAGHAQTPAVAVLAHGFFHHRIVLVPSGRIQSARTTSSPLQRRARLQTIHLDVARAAVAPALFDIDECAGEELRRSLPAPPLTARS